MLYAEVCETTQSQPNDDVTILVLRPNGLAIAAPLGKRLNAAWRFARLALGFGPPRTTSDDIDGPGRYPNPCPAWNRSNLLGPVVSWFNRLIGRDPRQEI